MKDTYDYLVIGAGAGGCPVASRLSENPDWQIAIIEAGGENTNDISRIPGAFTRVWGTDYDWKYKTTKQRGLYERIISHPRGHVMGGSTAINVGFWLRGSKGDYNSWDLETVPRWTFDTALRLFTEKIEDTCRGPNEYRGRGGMMHLQDVPSPSILSEKLEQGFNEVGFGIIADTNATDPRSVYRAEAIFRDHYRLTVADNYLSEKIRARENLDVITNTFVRRILFQEKRVVAVEVEFEGLIRVVNVTKEVILSAGAFNTPQILKLSGIGPREELEELGVELVSYVPGVGENLSDHLMSPINVFSPPGVDASVPMDSSDAAIAQWRKDRSGPAIYWSSNTVGYFAFGKTFDPDIELVMDYNPISVSSDLTAASSKDEKRGGYTINVILLQPASRGRVVLQSRDPKVPPLIDPCYLTERDDVARFIRAIRKATEITQSAPLMPFTDIVRPALGLSDIELEDHIRATATTVFHPAGTARIGTDFDPMAVVDPLLRVRGVEGLRVADTSVLPRVIRGHTMAPTIVVGEHLAEIIMRGK
jgi:choline dehydrogenase